MIEEFFKAVCLELQKANRALSEKDYVQLLEDIEAEVECRLECIEQDQK